MKKIGILTSGGDAPGMNAAVWASVKMAHSFGMTIYGIEQGYQGLLDGKVHELTGGEVENILHLGGTALGTARCKAMMTDEGRDAAAAATRELGIEGLIVVGGDGSFRGARELSLRGIPTVCLPGTIDNDLSYTDYTIGFDTACNTATDAIMKIRDTMMSHNRVAIIEVMGRDCGDIALTVSMAVGADYVLVPEVQYDCPFDQDNMIARLNYLRDRGKKYGLVVIAEGVENQYRHPASQLRQILQDRTDFDVRASTLGHMQRGGYPTMSDRRLAIEMGARGIHLLADGVGNRVIGIKNNRVFDQDIMEALKVERSFNTEMYDLFNKLASNR